MSASKRIEDADLLCRISREVLQHGEALEERTLIADPSIQCLLEDLRPASQEGIPGQSPAGRIQFNAGLGSHGTDDLEHRRSKLFLQPIHRNDLVCDVFSSGQGLCNRRVSGDADRW